MAGIYLHIPFCKTICGYCDFYSLTRLGRMDELVDAIVKEMAIRQNYLKGENVDTIYFGGGTPSLLNSGHWHKIFDGLNRHFTIDAGAEITIEMNPDDCTDSYIEMISALPANRVSLGIQSFRDELLIYMGRRHNARAARVAVKKLQHAGFDNISIDLIYALPGQTFEMWTEDLAEAVSMGVQHISSYHLGIEKGTRFHKLHKEGKLPEADESLSEMMFLHLHNTCEANGFEHYEISNFAIAGLYSKHNSAYWQRKAYLGLGPSAHSYNLDSRHWNVSHLERYITQTNEGKISGKGEKLSVTDKFNEHLSLSLRTSRGLNQAETIALFGEEKWAYILNQKRKINANLLVESPDGFKPNAKGWFVSDDIVSTLFWLD